MPQPANFGSLRRFFPECSVIGYQRMVNPSDGPAVNPGDGPAPNPSSSTWLGAEVAGEQQLSPRFAKGMGTGAAAAAVGGKQDGAAVQGQYRMLLNPEDSDEMQVHSTGEGTGWLMLFRHEQAVGVGRSGGRQMQEPLLTDLWRLFCTALSAGQPSSASEFVFSVVAPLSRCSYTNSPPPALCPQPADRLSRLCATRYQTKPFLLNHTSMPVVMLLCPPHMQLTDRLVALVRHEVLDNPLHFCQSYFLW